MPPTKATPASIFSSLAISRSKLSARWSGLDPETQRLARLLNTLQTLLLVISLFVFLNVFFSANPLVDGITAGLLLGFVLVSRYLLLRSQVRISAALLTTGLWLSLVASTFVNQFEGNGPFVGLVLVVIAAGLLLGSTAGFLVALLSSAVGLVYLAMTLSQGGLLPVLVPYDPTGYMITMVIIFFGAAGLVYLATSSLNEAVRSAHHNEQAMAESNRELEKMRLSLEDQVADRTRTLEQRTRYLQAAVEVSRATASILDTQRLVQTSVDLIREQFGLYYVGLFQTDSTGEWAVLKAGTGEAGRAMLSRGHRIRYGSGMIGWSIANAQPRVAANVGQDAVRLATAELPDTRSEAAIPLRSRGRVLGALTVQSEQPGAFGDMEIATFQALADQLAIALDNARLIAESQTALEEAQRAYGHISRKAWAEYIRSTSGLASPGNGGQDLTYRFELGQAGLVGSQEAWLSPADSGLLEETRRAVMQSRSPARLRLANQALLLLPIQVRDQVIGVATFIKNRLAAGASAGQLDALSQRQTPAWTTEEVDLLETILEQLGIAMDSARLYQDSQRLAFREQLVGEVTGRIRQTLDLETVMRTAVDEIQRTLNLPEVVISLAPPEEDPWPDTPQLEAIAAESGLSEVAQ